MSMHGSPGPDLQPASAPALDDEAIVRRVCAGEHTLFELLIRRHNQRIYRAVRSILKNEAEAEDAMQQAYIQAFTHLQQFAGTARFATWLTRIAVNEALARVRRGRTLLPVEEQDEERSMSMASHARSPEEQTQGRELATLLERTIDSLPEMYRTTLVLREVEGLSTAETSEVLEVTEDVVKTRLHRAKALAQERMLELAGAQAAEAFHFGAQRCDRVASGVMAWIARNR